MAEKLVPNYIFESSWEVCNKVGGIYTVLSTRAKTLQERFKDHLFLLVQIVGKKMNVRISLKIKSFLKIGKSNFLKT